MAITDVQLMQDVVTEFKNFNIGKGYNYDLYQPGDTRRNNLQYQNNNVRYNKGQPQNFISPYNCMPLLAMPPNNVGIFGPPPLPQNLSNQSNMVYNNVYSQQKLPTYQKRNCQTFEKEFNLSKLYNDSNAAVTKPNMKAFENIPVTQSGPHWTPVEPLNSFADMNLHPSLMENVRLRRYDTPTPVQKYAIKILAAKRDLMACAQTGSGKTAAFLLPIFNSMLNGSCLDVDNKMGDVCCPTLLVLAPTRELACQIYGESYKFSRGSSIASCVVYGGEKIQVQLNNVARGCHVLVATPGRLLALLTRNRVDLSRVQYLVFDEADRMLDMGFEPQIRRIVNEFGMPQIGLRQTLMFSATFPEEIQTKKKANWLAEQLTRRKFPVSAIHGNRDQMDRHTALTNFRSGRTPILVATGVASRGLDIPNVKHVVNYDLPYDIEEYIHRIGRTGRIGSSGIATSFFCSEKNLNVAKSLVDLLHQSKQNVPVWLAESAKNTNYGKKGLTNHQYGSTDHRSGQKSTSYVTAGPNFIPGITGSNQFNHNQSLVNRYQNNLNNPAQTARTQYSQNNSSRWDNGVTAAAMYNQGFYSAHNNLPNHSSNGANNQHIDSYSAQSSANGFGNHMALITPKPNGTGIPGDYQSYAVPFYPNNGVNPTSDSMQTNNTQLHTPSDQHHRAIVSNAQPMVGNHFYNQYYEPNVGTSEWYGNQ